MSKRNLWNRRKRRDRLHIMAEMLETAKEGALKTQIMYRANLSFAQLNAYLSYLLEIKLLETIVTDRETIYKATDKGIKYLQGHMKIIGLLKKKEG